MWVWAFWGLCLIQCTLYAFTPHIEELQHVPSPIKTYHLVDLGETDISITRLTRIQQGLSYAPTINNRSQVSWNLLEGGLLKSWKSSKEDFIPRFDGMRLYIMGLNDNGDLLIAIERGYDSTEWLLWPHEENEYKSRQHIHTFDPFSPDLVLSDFNSNGRVVGYYKKKSSKEPASWTASEGLHTLGKSEGLDALGVARAINDHNTIAGLHESMKVYSPFVWSADLGFEVMRNYRDKLFPVGWMEFSDILITHDDVVYGNYWLKHSKHDDLPMNSTFHYGYVWKPRESSIEQLDLEGMRLTAINQQHTLVGCWQGRAALCLVNRRPATLESLMGLEELEGWELLEVTGINDKGEMVGYGMYHGKPHIFLAEPL